jgi:hypothetical protein
LRNLSAERRKILRSYPFKFPDRIAIEEEGSPEEQEELRAVTESLDALDKGLIYLKWLSLRSRAAELGLFVDWGENKAEELFAEEDLSAFKKEMSELRLVIRKERNERWQFWELRLRVLIAFAGALTGAIGAAIGLIAILRK